MGLVIGQGTTVTGQGYVLVRKWYIKLVKWKPEMRQRIIVMGQCFDGMKEHCGELGSSEVVQVITVI